MIYEIRFTKEAKKDVAQLSPKLKQKLKKMIQEQIIMNPYGDKKLVGDLTGFFSLRLNYK
jgi:mRNA interferase RelE/StbE